MAREVSLLYLRDSAPSPDADTLTALAFRIEELKTRVDDVVAPLDRALRRLTKSNDAFIVAISIEDDHYRFVAANVDPHHPRQATSSVPADVVDRGVRAFSGYLRKHGLHQAEA